MSRRTGPLARISLFRLSVFGVIVVTTVLAVALPVGLFRFVFRAALVVGIVLILGSYIVQWWVKKRRRA